MKRYICFILCFLCLLSFFEVAFADQYTIHNGVSFGDSKNDVIEKEKSAGIELKEYIGDLPVCPFHSTLLFCREIKLAGFDNATLIYHLDFDNKLSSCIYQLYYGGVNVETISNFNDVNSLLTRKYGKSNNKLNTAILNGYLDLCVNHIYDDTIESLKMFSPVVKTKIANTYTTKVNSEDIVVIHICIKDFIVRGDTTETLNINYSIIDENTYNSAINSIESDGQKAYDDL